MPIALASTSSVDASRHARDDVLAMEVVARRQHRDENAHDYAQIVGTISTARYTYQYSDMSGANKRQELENLRRAIAQKVRSLRTERGWTQAELAGHLRISQARLSEVERGDGSFSAEQFLTILRLFNAAPDDFALRKSEKLSQLQNALARLGALQLVESEDVLPSDRLRDVVDVVRETLVGVESPRLVTALAPVLVRNIDRIHPGALRREVFEAGLARRFGWLIDNTLEAVRRELQTSLPKTWGRLYRRAEVVLQAWLAAFGPHDEESADVLDPGIRTKKTFEEVAAARSDISRRWSIITSLQPEDFAEALRGARVAR